jgi:hypothetical protein
MKKIIFIVVLILVFFQANLNFYVLIDFTTIIIEEVIGLDHNGFILEKVQCLFPGHWVMVIKDYNSF